MEPNPALCNIRIWAESWKSACANELQKWEYKVSDIFIQTQTLGIVYSFLLPISRRDERWIRNRIKLKKTTWYILRKNTHNNIVAEGHESMRQNWKNRIQLKCGITNIRVTLIRNWARKYYLAIRCFILPFIIINLSNKIFSNASTLYFVACHIRGPYPPKRLIVFPANMPASFSPHTTVQDKGNN